jgi:hypothetical protein
MTKSVASRTQIAEKERANSMALSEELEATKRELAKVRSRADAVSGGGGGGGTVKEGELQEERNKLYSILRCSTCQLRLRTHCITVCMHSQSPARSLSCELIDRLIDSPSYSLLQGVHRRAGPDPAAQVSRMQHRFCRLSSPANIFPVRGDSCPFSQSLRF